MTSGSQSKGSNAPPTNNALPEYLYQHLSIYNLMALYKYTFTISIIDIIISRCGPINVQKTAVFSLIMFSDFVTFQLLRSMDYQYCNACVFTLKWAHKKPADNDGDESKVYKKG